MTGELVVMKTPGRTARPRGDCWLEDERHCRSAIRHKDGPVYWNLNVGFRVAAVQVSSKLPGT